MEYLYECQLPVNRSAQSSKKEGLVQAKAQSQDMQVFLG